MNGKIDIIINMKYYIGDIIFFKDGSTYHIINFEKYYENLKENYYLAISGECQGLYDKYTIERYKI